MFEPHYAQELGVNLDTNWLVTVDCKQREQDAVLREQL